MTKKTETPLALVNEKTGEIMQSEHVASAEMEIQATIILAKKFPRNEESAFGNLMKSCDRLSFAKEAEYSFPRGGTTVRGPSVNLAREAARVWQNMRYGLKIVQNLDDDITIEGWAWDIETNVKVACQDSFQKLIQRKGKGWVKPDERDLRELVNRRGAIAIRNSILQLLPRDFIEDAQNECQKTRKSNQKDPKKAVKDLIMAFSKLKPFGISVEMLEKYLTHPLNECNADQVDDLRLVYTSLLDGNSTWSDYVENGNESKETIRGNLNVEDLKTKEDEPKKDAGISVEHAVKDAAEQQTIAGINAVWKKYQSLHNDENFVDCVNQTRANIESAAEALEAHEAGEQQVIDDEVKKGEDGRKNGLFDQPGK